MAQNMKGPRGAKPHGPFGCVQHGREHFEDSTAASRSQLPPELRRAQCRHWAGEYRAAARRNAQAAKELGGKQGVALSRLAEHYARRAAALSVLAGGLPA